MLWNQNACWFLAGVIEMDSTQEVLLCERELMENNTYKPLASVSKFAFWWGLY